MIRIRSALAGAACFLAIASASAQQFNNVADHSVIGRIGTGSGSGPSQAIPFASLLANLPPIANSNLSTMSAWTIKMNNSGSAAIPSDVTIDALTVKGSPAASDEVLIWDVAGAAMKKAAVSAIASAGAVGSLNGQTGTLTLNGGLNNSSTTFQLDGNYTGFANPNCTLAASVSGNNLTVALKNNAGSDPSSTSPCFLNFRSATAATGSTSLVAVTAATSFVANSGSTFGITNSAATCSAASSCPFRLWVTAINNAGTVVLGVTALTNASGVLPLNEGNVISTTACSACATATALGTMYSTASQTSKAFKILGYLDWGSGLATAGTYASGPTLIQSMGPGVKKPGDTVQELYFTTSSSASTSSATFSATNLTGSITPTSTVNLVQINAGGPLLNTVQTTAAQAQLRRATGPVLFGSWCIASISATITFLENGCSFVGVDTPGTVSAVSYAVALASSAGAGSVSFPVSGTTATMIIKEIMGALPEIIPDNDNDPRLLNKVG